MDKYEAREKARIIKEALMIVDKLADIDYDEYEEMQELIDKATKLKKNRFWKLK
jgi:hypothetical protein